MIVYYTFKSPDDMREVLLDNFARLYNIYTGQILYCTTRTDFSSSGDDVTSYELASYYSSLNEAVESFEDTFDNPDSNWIDNITDEGGYCDYNDFSSPYVDTIINKNYNKLGWIDADKSNLSELNCIHHFVYEGNTIDNDNT